MPKFQGIPVDFEEQPKQTRFAGVPVDQEIEDTQDLNSQGQRTQIITKRGPGRKRISVEVPVQDTFESLPDEIVQEIKDKTNISGRGSGAVAGIRRRLANLERIRQVNPDLADIIENTSEGEALLIGAGKTTSDLGKGIGRLLGFLDQDEVKDEEFAKLSSVRSGAEGGENIAQAAIFALPGSATAKIPNLASRAAANASLGIAEAGLDSLGEGDDTKTVVKKSLVGGLAGGVGGEIIPALGKGAKALDFKRARASQQQARTARQGPAPASPRMQEVKRKISEGVADRDTAGYRIDNRGRLVRDRLEGEVIDQGWSDSITPVIKASSSADRRNMRDMVNIYQRGTENALERASRRPADVLGRSIMQRYNTVRQLNSEAGRELDNIAQSELRDQVVDFSPAIDNFRGELGRRGIVVNDDWTLDFTDSTIEFKPAARRRLNQIIEKMRRASPARSNMPTSQSNANLRDHGDGGVDAYRGHKVKQFIREMLDYNGTGRFDASKDIDNILKGLTRDIDRVLDNNFPEYRLVNDQFHDTRTALDSWQREAGSKFRPDQPNVNSFTGTVARTFMSNNRGRAPLYSAMTDLEDVARAYGTQFDDNIMNQVVFIEEMERFLGPSASTSLFGDVDKAIQRGLSAAAGRGGAVDIAVDAAQGVANKIKGRNQENALRRMREYLNSFEQREAG